MTYSFHELLINSSKDLLCEVHFLSHRRNNVYKYNLKRKPIVKVIKIDIHFHLFLMIFMMEDLVF